jgi:hypothetical protein
MRRDGHHWVLDGTKRYITIGPVADVLLVSSCSAALRNRRFVIWGVCIRVFLRGATQRERAYQSGIPLGCGGGLAAIPVFDYSGTYDEDLFYHYQWLRIGISNTLDNARHGFPAGSAEGSRS